MRQNRKIDDSKIAEYNQAYQYLLSKTKDSSVSELNDVFHTGSLQTTQNINPNIINKLNTIVVKPSKYSGKISDEEQIKADIYIGEIGQGFTATPDDFNNKDVFLLNTLAGNTNKNSKHYNDKKEFIQNSAAIKDNEIDFLERSKTVVDEDIGTIKGLTTGIVTGAKDTVVGIYDFLKSPIENTKEVLIFTADAVKNLPQTAQNIKEALGDGVEKYETTIDLYQMQKDTGAEAEYKASILGEVIGSGGVGAVVKKGKDTIIDAVDTVKKSKQDATIEEEARTQQIIENNIDKENDVWSNQASGQVEYTPNAIKTTYPAHFFDDKNRTVLADKEGTYIIDQMKGVVSPEKAKSITVMTHQDGTVSIGLSMDLTVPGGLERIKNLQTHLDKLEPGKYRVGTETLNNENGIIEVELPIPGNAPGICSEPKCAVVAGKNSSPVTGFATLWRGKGENPYLYRGENASQLSPNQMDPCPTCGLPDNQNIYNQAITQPSKIIGIQPNAKQ